MKGVKESNRKRGAKVFSWERNVLSLLILIWTGVNKKRESKQHFFSHHCYINNVTKVAHVSKALVAKLIFLEARKEHLIVLYFVEKKSLYADSLNVNCILLTCSLFFFLTRAQPVVLGFLWASDYLITQMNGCCNGWTLAKKPDHSYLLSSVWA